MIEVPVMKLRYQRGKMYADGLLYEPDDRLLAFRVVVHDALSVSLTYEPSGSREDRSP